MDIKLDTGASGVTVTDAVTFTGPLASPLGVIATFKVKQPPSPTGPYSLVQAGPVASVTGTTTGVTPTCAATIAGNLLVIAFGSGVGNITVTLPGGWEVGMVSTNAKP